MQKNLLKTNSFINKYQSLIDQINNFEDNIKLLSDTELRARNFKLRQQYKEDGNLDSLIAESFALTREASLRTLGLRHFDVQLMGGLVLNNQKIGKGGEIQLADAIDFLAKKNRVETVKLKGKRFDCGSVKGYLQGINFVANKLKIN